MKGDLANLDATEQAELVRRKEVSPLELVDAAITRIGAVNPQLTLSSRRCSTRRVRTRELVTTREDPTAGWDRLMEVIQFTPPYNATGQPAISLPPHWNAVGLPIGFHLVAAFGRENLLIQASSQLEQARPWKERRPPICALQADRFDAVGLMSRRTSLG
jgi:Asp-tRNA(Asn)/Glu-tRNA(Gln) amidotransferase A subunit family amidase